MGKDPQGINHGYSNLELSVRDMTKLGLLYLNKGRWDKKTDYKFILDKEIFKDPFLPK